MPSLSTLEWDSQFFGKRIARLDITDTIPATSVVEDYIHKHNIEVVQTCIPTSQETSIYWLEKNLFHFVDLRITLTLDLAPLTPAPVPHIRKATPQDTPALTAITHGAFTQDSRFNWHSLFPKEKIDAFYTAWVTNSIKGTHDDACFMYMDGNNPLGLVTIRHLSPTHLRMGIMGIAPAAQGKGIGSQLSRFVHHYAKEKGHRYIEAITEGRNLITQNFHAKNGMKTTAIESWYYRITQTTAGAGLTLQ